MEQCKYPSPDETVRKYMYTGIEVILKEKAILSFEAMWMTLEYITLSKINQTQKENYYRISCVNY